MKIVSAVLELQAVTRADVVDLAGSLLQLLIANASGARKIEVVD
jgi:hypothetical protein